MKTVIFDLGGVLIHVNWDRVRCPLSRVSPWGAASILKEVTTGEIVLSFMRGHLEPHQFHRSLCEKLSMTIGYEDFVDIWTGLFTANPGIVPLVRGLKSRYRLVLGSNTDQLHFSRAQVQFDILKYFERNFLSYEMAYLKPDPEFFAQILKRLKVSPTECVFIDDRSENVRSAASLGIAAVQFESNEQLEATLRRLLP